MDFTIFIIAIDKTRRHILQVLMKRCGWQVQLFENFIAGRRAMYENSPRIAIIDTIGYPGSATSLVQKLYDAFAGSIMLVLADEAMVAPIEALGMTHAVCFADPLDPDMIVAKVRECAQLKKKSRGRSVSEEKKAAEPVIEDIAEVDEESVEDLTETIKDFLKL